MDLYKLTHDIWEATKHWHLPLLAGLFGVIKTHKPDLKDEISDLGDLGDNVPATLIKSLSSRRGSLRSLLFFYATPVCRQAGRKER